MLDGLIKFVLLTVLGFFIVMLLVGHSFISGEMWDEFCAFPWYAKAGIVFYAFIMFGGKEGWTPKFERWFATKENKSLVDVASSRVDWSKPKEEVAEQTQSSNLPEEYVMGYQKYNDMLKGKK